MKIRIAVAVDKDGKWGAIGTHDAPESAREAINILAEYLDDNVLIQVVEAEVQVPEEIVVQGKTVEV